MFNRFLPGGRIIPTTAFFVMFTGVFLVVFISSIVISFLLPEAFASTARIRINPGTNEVSKPYSSQTELETIRSEAVLSQVVEALKLNSEWALVYGGGGPLKTSESIALLRRCLDLRPVPNTTFIDIQAFSEKPEQAAQIANAVAESYRNYWQDRPEFRVEIINHAAVHDRPVRPNKPVIIVTGALLGTVLGSLAGAAAAGIVTIFQRRTSNPPATR